MRPNLPMPMESGFLTKKSTLGNLWKSIKNRVEVRIRIMGEDDTWESLRGRVVAIQEKECTKLEWTTKCRLIFTMYLSTGERIRFLYVTGHSEEYDHIHEESDVHNPPCSTERAYGWPELPEVCNPYDIF